MPTRLLQWPWGPFGAPGEHTPPCRERGAGEGRVYLSKHCRRWFCRIHQRRLSARPVGPPFCPGVMHGQSMSLCLPQSLGAPTLLAHSSHEPQAGSSPTLHCLGLVGRLCTAGTKRTAAPWPCTCTSQAHVERKPGWTTCYRGVLRWGNYKEEWRTRVCLQLRGWFITRKDMGFGSGVWDGFLNWWSFHAGPLYCPFVLSLVKSGGRRTSGWLSGQSMRLLILGLGVQASYWA